MKRGATILETLFELAQGGTNLVVMWEERSSNAIVSHCACMRGSTDRAERCNWFQQVNKPTTHADQILPSEFVNLVRTHPYGKFNHRCHECGKLFL